MEVIRIDNLCKSYGATVVLDQVRFSLDEGKLVGFLGPNGAGKTTTIRILLGLLKPNSGTIEVFGQPVQQAGKIIRSNIGYLPGDVHLYSNLTGRQTLRFLANARGKKCDSEMDRLAESLKLPLNRIVRKYSTGMRQKLGLIQALMHRPKLLILDEPTSALDPLIRKAVFAELRRVIDDGRTVLFSSHSLDEVEELCDEVIILRSGKVVEQQKIETLRARALKRVEVEFDVEVPKNLIPDNFKVSTHNSNRITGTWVGNIKPLIEFLEQHDVKDVVIAQPDLNDLFLAYYSEKSTTPQGEPVD